MNPNQIPYGKIAFKTFLKVLAIIIVIFILNTWPQIKQSFNGQVPDLNYWLDHSFKPSNILLIILFGGYFFYQGINQEKEALSKPTDPAA